MICLLVYQKSKRGDICMMAITVIVIECLFKSPNEKNGVGKNHTKKSQLSNKDQDRNQ